MLPIGYVVAVFALIVQVILAGVGQPLRLPPLQRLPRAPDLGAAASTWACVPATSASAPRSASSRSCSWAWC